MHSKVGVRLHALSARYVKYVKLPLVEHCRTSLNKCWCECEFRLRFLLTPRYTYMHADALMHLKQNDKVVP